ncbi:MAG: 3-hydroxyacyl-ACP dehydratase FabZ [Alphaproteobacteria bacterium]|nr:3-hydroxyacyl-ACP dehydratase FabZ [Alphaproteobacteria bacterium]
MDREGIEAALPHRDPFVMVDELVEVELRKRAVAIKRVRADEDWARGHFPGNPVFPGVLLIEALAQTAALCYLADPEMAGMGVFLLGVDKMRFRKVVRPGDELRLEVTVTAEKRKIVFFDVLATVGGDKVADGGIMATLQEER